MAIDTTVFGADLPAGAYTAGQIIPLTCIAGPANVRSGRGQAILKNTFVGRIGSAPTVRIHIKNSDWIDEVQSIAVNNLDSAASRVIFSPHSGQTQNGHDYNLTPNSGWQVYAEILAPVTTTADESVYALIDVDYPSVSAVVDPRTLNGVPVSIDFDKSITAFKPGQLVAATWTTESTDYFKAGFKYCLEKVEMSYTGDMFGFIAFSNAAGMGGLQRIIPIVGDVAGIRYPVQYASILEKGPMDVKTMFFTSAGGAAAFKMIHDYVKKGQ